ncbi:MAG: glycosyltransferase family 39 protein [Chloroflexi bacterium]|nr:glycosyltransferase family 39 protein [Chloroflexota bacterium]
MPVEADGGRGAIESADLAIARRVVESLRGVTELSSPAADARSPLDRLLTAIDRRLAREEPIITVHGVEVIYLAVLAALLVLSWSGLALAELGRFSIGGLGLLALAAAAGAVVALRRTRFGFPITWSADVLGALPALILAVALFTPPFEFILGAADAGVYISTGINIARTGSIGIVDHEMAALAKAGLADLFAVHGRMDGFYTVDVERGLVAPHAFHLFPTVLAIAYGLGGIWASLWATPVIAILGVVGFYLLARRLFGGVVAPLAAALLVVNPAVIWFARYPVAENLVLLWLFGGLVAFVMMLDIRSRWLAVLAGLLLGAVHLTKIETVMLPVALGSFFAYQWVVRRWRAEHGYFLAAYGLVLLHAALHAHFVSTGYTYYVLDAVVLQGAELARLAAPAGLGALALLGLVLGRDWIARGLERLPLSRLTPTVAGGILLLAAYAYYIRPRLGAPSEPIAALSPEAAYAQVNRLSFVILGWYVSPIGLLLGTLGYIVAVTRAGSTRTAVVLTLALLDTVLHLYDGRVRPLHFWAARRYLPVIFPAFALFNAYLLWRLQHALRGRWPEAALPALLGLIMLASGLGGWLPFRSHVEYRGAVEQIGHLAAQIPEGSVVLFDDSDAGRRLSTPVQFIGGRPSFILWKPADEDGTGGRVIADLMARGREVYWVRSGSPPEVAKWGYRGTLVASTVIDLPEALASMDHRPDVIGRFRYELQVYRIRE